MTTRKVFISYRRDDAAGFANAIHDRLVEHIPVDHVFMDVLGIVVLVVMIDSMFMTEVGMPTVLGTLCFVFNAVPLLRLPVHQWVRTLTRQRALTIGAVMHLVGFAIMSAGASDIDGVMIFVFGIVPAASLFLASFAMKRLVRS